MEIPRVRSRTLSLVAAGLVIWSVVLWFAWASQPLTDEIAVIASDDAVAALGDDAEAIAALQADVARTVPATCGKAWQSSSGPRPPLPALAKGEQYVDVPCQRVVSDNRIVLGLNVAMVFFGLLAVVVLAPRRIRSSDDENSLITPDLTAIA